MFFDKKYDNATLGQYKEFAERLQNINDDANQLFNDVKLVYGPKHRMFYSSQTLAKKASEVQKNLELSAQAKFSGTMSPEQIHDMVYLRYISDEVINF